MITKGSKIKLVKPMGIFKNVGEVCEVVELSCNDNVIYFRFGGAHLGCMSPDELNKYFVVVEDEKPRKRNWSEWFDDRYVYQHANGETYIVPVKFRHDATEVQLRGYYDDRTFRVKARCHGDDKFDIEKGLDLADARLAAKLMQYEANKMAKNM